MWWKKLLFTGFYTGYTPVAPGTAGSLLAFLIYAIEYFLFGSVSWLVNLIIVLVMIYPSIKLGDLSEVFFGRKDPSEVVLDEMMGYWISVLFYPFSWKVASLALILFRIMDITKPYPIRSIENKDGGIGIMMDDFISGIYANIVLLIIILVSSFFGVSFY